ncbi:MAG TPA: alpha/beta fold hydrolase [Thermoanaerobaculia bacterium]|nr:alpha/beta fold hydrolase [Thermoanaerobaculia bacterium]
MRHSVRPLEVPDAEPWQAVVEDPVVGPVKLSGRLRQCPPVAAAAGGGELVVLLHGLGGTIDSHYIRRGALAAEAAGLSCLRLHLRGADLSGEDYYHAGLTADLHAALASQELRPYDRIYVLGYSLGGHLVLRFATEPGDPRVVSVAAVCAPLDLGRAQQAIDRPDRWLYRRYLLSNLACLYAAVAARRPVPLPLAEVERLRKLRDYDERVVAPRHGFAGADDYYRRASVAPRLGELRLPALLVNSAGDPMVAASAVRPALELPVPRLEVRWVAGGGHVGFPRGVDLGLDPKAGLDRGAGERAAEAAAPGVDDQVLAWLRAAREAPAQDAPANQATRPALAPPAFPASAAPLAEPAAATELAAGTGAR